MNTWSRIGSILQVSALAVVFAACTGPTAPATTPPLATPSATPSAATPSPTATATVTSSPGAIELPPLGGPLEPGTYTTVIGGYRWTFTVHGAGWESGESPTQKVVLIKDPGTDPESYGAMFVYGSVTGLERSACHWKDDDAYQGTDAVQYAAALAQIRGFETSGPTDLAFSGYDGALVQLTVPTDVDFAACDNGEYQTFEGRYDYSAGQVERVRIMDLDGIGHLYFTVALVDTPAALVAELQKIADSMRIEPAE